MQRKGNPCALLVGMQFGAATMENSMEVVPWKIKNRTTIWSSLPYDPAIPFLGIYLKKKENTNSKRYMHSYAYCSIIHNCQSMETY